MSDLTLRRRAKLQSGVFGELFDHNPNFKERFVESTLEHAFLVDGQYLAKLAPGRYTCRRGTHQLEHGEPFETFEILGVPDFEGKPVTGILFHIGNFNRDSLGCVCVGMITAITQDSIAASVIAFKRFMAAQEGVNEFELEVLDPA